MQSASASLPNLRPGHLTPARLAASLAEWVTAGHRAYPAHPIVYHAGEIGPEIADTIDRSARFAAETERLLGPVVHPHFPHPYWVGALDHHLATARRPVDPAPLAAILGPGSVLAAPGSLRHRLLGRMPLPRPWHPHWADLRAVQACLARLATGHALLIVSAEPAVIRGHLMAVARLAGARDVLHLQPDDLIVSQNTNGRFDAVMAVVRPDAAAGVAAVRDAMTGLLEASATVVVAITDLSDNVPRAVTAAAIINATGASHDLARVEGISASGWRVSAQASMMARARATIRARTMPARLGHLAAGIASACLSLIANLVCSRGIEPGKTGRCSTLLLYFTAGRSSPAIDPSPRTLELAETWTA
jgi:hypothetical protein